MFEATFIQPNNCRVESSGLDVAEIRPKFCVKH